MTDLSSKFGAVTAQLDTIIAKLDDLTTAVSASGGNADIVDAIEDVLSRLDTAQTMNGSRNVLLAAILSAIGDISGYPPNYTVRRLLAMLQTTLDEEPPQLINNPSPGAEFACGPWTLQTGWALVGIYSLSGTAYKAYTPWFDNVTSPFPLGFQSNPSNTRRIIGAVGPSDRDICLGWNTTGHTEPAAIGYIGKTLTTAENWFDDFANASFVWIETPQMPVGVVSAATHAYANGAWIATGDVCVEYIVLYPFDMPAPTWLDFSISSGGG
jgi:hypothetical protein